MTIVLFVTPTQIKSLSRLFFLRSLNIKKIKLDMRHDSYAEPYVKLSLTQGSGKAGKKIVGKKKGSFIT